MKEKSISSKSYCFTAFLMKRNYTGNEFWKDKKQITYHFWLCRIYCLAALCSLPHNCKHRIHTYLCRIGCMYHKQHIHLDLKGKLASFLRRFIVGYFFPPEEYIFFPNFGNRLFFFFFFFNERANSNISFQTTESEHKIHYYFKSYRQDQA